MAKNTEVKETEVDEISVLKAKLADAEAKLAEANKPKKGAFLGKKFVKEPDPAKGELASDASGKLVKFAQNENTEKILIEAGWEAA